MSCVVGREELTKLTTTLEEIRKHILHCKSGFISTISKGIMLSEESKAPPLSSRKLIPNHVDIYLICSEEDAKYCHLFSQLLISHNPSLIVRKYFEETNSSRLSYLENSSLVISLLSPHFMSSPELVHELNIAWLRQRYAQEFCFLEIILDSVSIKPTYVHLLPCFFHCKDKRWNDVLEIKENPSSLENLRRTHDVPAEVIRCFVAAIKFANSWITSNECSVWGLRNKLSNYFHLANCLEHFTKSSGIPKN